MHGCIITEYNDDVKGFLHFYKKLGMLPIIFEGDIRFGNSFSLEDTVLPDISFNEAMFNGDVYFSRVIFNGCADFSDATFSGTVLFFGTTFTKITHFTGAIFTNRVSFSKIVIYKDGIRQETIFTQFYDDAFFLGTTLNGKIYFIEVIFKKEADFSGATFNQDAYFFGKTFEGIGSLRSLTIENKIRFEEVDLKKVSFIDTDLRRVTFVNCQWCFKRNRRMLYDELNVIEQFRGGHTTLLILDYLMKKKQVLMNKKPPNGMSLTKPIRDSAFNFKKVEILYRQLKQKYKEEHNEPEVSNWHYGEKEMYRKGSLFRRFFPFSLSNLYWFSSGYGERPVRAGVVLFLLILTISVLFGLIGLVPSNGSLSYEINEIKGWADIMNFQKLYTLVLNTLQYATFEKEPDFIPKTIYGGYLKLAARILIPLQAALFALAVRNRFRR